MYHCLVFIIYLFNSILGESFGGKMRAGISLYDSVPRYPLWRRATSLHYFSSTPSITKLRIYPAPPPHTWATLVPPLAHASCNSVILLYMPRNRYPLQAKRIPPGIKDRLTCHIQHHTRPPMSLACLHPTHTARTGYHIFQFSLMLYELLSLSKPYRAHCQSCLGAAILFS